MSVIVLLFKLPVEAVAVCSVSFAASKVPEAIFWAELLSKIVSSLVDDIIMPVVGVIIGGHDFSNLSIKVGNASIMYGSFIQNIIDFLIIAFCVFVFVKLINKFLVKEHKEEVKKEEIKKSEEVLLLEEIRDLLKKNNKKK